MSELDPDLETRSGGGLSFGLKIRGDGYATESRHGYIFDYGGQGESFFYFLPPKTIVA